MVAAMTKAGLRRDDVDRLLVVGGIAWSWVAVPALITATDAGPDVSLALVTWLAIMPLVVLFAALALWRNLAWARPVLLFLVALSGIASVLFLGRPAVAAAALAGAVVTGWGAFRLGFHHRSCRPTGPTPPCPPRSWCQATSQDDPAPRTRPCGHSSIGPRTSTQTGRASWGRPGGPSTRTNGTPPGW